MKKTLVYLTVGVPFGGAEQFLLTELDMLKRLGVRLLIVPRSPGRMIFHQKAARLAPETLRVGLVSIRILAGSLRCLMSNPSKCSAVLREILVSSRDWRIAAKNLAVVPKAFWLSRILDAAAIGHIHASWGTTPATIAYILGALTGIPWSMTLHRGDIVEDNLLESKVRSAEFVRCISAGGRDLLRGIIGDRYGEKIKVLHLGVEADPHHAKPSPKTNIFTIVAAANLLPVKGLIYLIAACELLRERGERDFQCNIYGDGPLRRELAEEIERRNLSDVVALAGSIPNEELIDIYRRRWADVFVLPSINTRDGQHEGIPYSLMEAMSWGVPVISTDTGAIPELLGGGTGIVVREKDPQALADAIQRVRADSDGREKSIEKAMSVIAEKFDLRVNTEAFIRMMELSPSPEHAGTVDVAQSGVLGGRGGPLRVLHVIPGRPIGNSMIFARRQVESIRRMGVAVRIFDRMEGISPAQVVSEWMRLRREIKAYCPDVIHSQYGTLTALLCSLSSRLPLVITFRGSDLNPTPSMGLIRSCAGKMLSQLSALRAAQIICVSRQLRERLWWRRDQAVILPSGIDLDCYYPQSSAESRESLGWPKEGPVVLFNAGKNSAVKRFDLAQAAIEHARISFPNLIFKVLDGDTSPHDIPRMLNASTCLLLTSDWEGSPNIVKEAVACRLPVVSVDVGDIRRWLLGVTPSRIVARDAVSIAQGLCDVIKQGARSNGNERLVGIAEAAVAARLCTIYENCVAMERSLSA